MSPPSWRAVALLAALALGAPAGATTPPARQPGSAPPQEDKGAGGREPATQLPHPGRPAPPPASASGAETGNAAGSGVGSAAGAPGTPGTATATEANVPGAGSAPTGTIVQGITGTIDTVDPADRTVRLASADVRLRVGPDARVIRNGRPASLSQLRRGDVVRATCPGAPDVAGAQELDATGTR